QAHADRLLGYTDLDGVGFVVSEVSPYEADLDWSELTEPDEITPVVDALGRATAKAHCVGDSDADVSVVDFAHTYAAQVRDDHDLFVEAFRSGQVPGWRPPSRADAVGGP